MKTIVTRKHMLGYFVAAVLLMSSLVAGPATAATERKQRNETWVGQVVRDGRHFDYRGSACPATAEACVKMLANYRIVPLNPRAAFALRRVAGGQAKLIGYHAPSNDGEHNGVLYVRRVRRA